MLIGESSAIQAVMETIEKVAQTDSTILIAGESGTGKELVARAIHALSARTDQPLIVVNCAAIPGDLIEAELFGHVKGAFTGAHVSRQGRFECAHTGTIFLDEVGELPLDVQAKLLRVLQYRQFEPVGSSQTIEVDVRIIAATNRDLEAMVRDRTFREDLFYRLHVIPLMLPTLRERRSDIPLLIRHFMASCNRLTGHDVHVPEGPVMDALMHYDWPGNIRELENVIERLVIMKGHNGTIALDDIPAHIFRSSMDAQPNATGALSAREFPYMLLPAQGLDLKAVVSAFEHHLVDQALARTKGNKNRASELLSMNRTTLVEKLRKRGLIAPLGARAIRTYLEDEETPSGHA